MDANIVCMGFECYLAMQLETSADGTRIFGDETCHKALNGLIEGHSARYRSVKHCAELMTRVSVLLTSRANGNILRLK